jgi:hypothetical protein
MKKQLIGIVFLNVGRIIGANISFSTFKYSYSIQLQNVRPLKFSAHQVSSLIMNCTYHVYIKFIYEMKDMFKKNAADTIYTAI